MKNRRLRNVVSIHKGQRVRVQRCHCAHALVQGNQTVPRLDQRSKHLQRVRISRAHLDRFRAQLHPPSSVPTVRHLDQHRTLTFQRRTVVSIRNTARRFLLPAPQLWIRRPTPHVEHDGSCRQGRRMEMEIEIEKLLSRRYLFISFRKGHTVVVE